MNWKDDKKWSDKFIPVIREIVGPMLLVPAPLIVDQKCATDLVVLTTKNLMIACRIRRPGFLARYKNDFTIRSHRDSGAETEQRKITDGWADWMFYGHSDFAEVGLAYWMLLDLSAYRAHLIRNRKAIRWGETNNHDGTSFVWYDVTSFVGEPKLVIACSHVDQPVEAF